MNKWNDPFFQPEGIKGGYYCSRQQGTGGEIRVYADGTVKMNGTVPADVVLAVIFAAHPKLVITARRQERAKYLEQAAEAIEGAWDEVAGQPMTQKDLETAQQVRSRWKGSNSAVKRGR